jgi:hypothetical protein
VGFDSELRVRLVSAFHDSPQGGLPGFLVTYRRLSSLFSWPGMKTMAKEYVRSYHTCQQAQARILSSGWIVAPPACALSALGGGNDGLH